MSIYRSNSFHEIDNHPFFRKFPRRPLWDVISYYCPRSRSCNNLEEWEDYDDAIPEEGTNYGRKQSACRSTCDSPRESILSRKTFQSESSAMSRLERARVARERFEADRQRRLDQLQEARRQAEVFREQQMLLKKKRIEESKAKDYERRKCVEERRKKLEDIEKARRENIQKKLERIGRANETRRCSTGPSGTRIFGFGSCTPREICTPIRHTYSSLPDHDSKQRRDPSKPSRTVLFSSLRSRRYDDGDVLPHPIEKDKLDRTVSTPNIASNNQKFRSRRNESGVHSPTRSLERGRRPPSAMSRSMMAERPRPASALGHPRLDPPAPRRSISSLGVSSASTNASSGIFDRLSQPRRVLPRSEEVPTERKRNFVSVPTTSPNGDNRKPTARKTLKPVTNDAIDVVKPSSVSFHIEPEEESSKSSDDRLSVQVNVEDVEADALNDISSELTTTGISKVDEEKEVSDLLRNDAPLRPDRSASPPRTLQLKTEAANAPQISISSSPTPTRPTLQRPNSANADAVDSSIHPATDVLPPPSPSATMHKGSAPSTPTGQRASSTREVTEEEYKQRLAEQRRLARERMAAQEAEKARAREEERRKREEELQRLREEAERQRIEEEEERKRQEEEERIEKERKEREEEEHRLQEEREREEIERREREEREYRQRVLEEERLVQQKEEEEKRLERKKRLESIMSRVKKTSDVSGSRESLTSSHLDLSTASNGSDAAITETERSVSPAPQFKSALLQSMLSKGKLSTSIRAVSALRRSQGYNGSTGSLIGDIQNLSRSSENLSSTSNTGPTVPSSSSGEMSVSQIEDQLSPPPVVSPAMWRSHPNGIPGLGGHERDVDDQQVFDDEEVETNPALIDDSIQSRLIEMRSSGNSNLAQETRRTRPNSVHFDDMVPMARGGTVSRDIVDDESTSSDADASLLTDNTVSGQWLTEDSQFNTNISARTMADTMS